MTTQKFGLTLLLAEAAQESLNKNIPRSWRQDLMRSSTAMLGGDRDLTVG